MQDKNNYNKIFTIPNFLSLIRIALIPVMFYLFRAKKFIETAVVLVVSAITDLADGFIARKFNMVSKLGKALDPIADKLTQGVVLLFLLQYFPYMLLPLSLLLVKEVLTGISQLIVLIKYDVVLGAVWHGKLTTAFLYSMAFLHIVWVDIPKVLSIVLVSVCLCLMVFSLIAYNVRNFRVIKNGKQSSNDLE